MPKPRSGPNGRVNQSTCNASWAGRELGAPMVQHTARCPVTQAAASTRAQWSTVTV